MPFKFRILPSSELCLLGYTGHVSASDLDGVWKATQTTADYSTELDDLVVLGPDAEYSEVATRLTQEHARKFVEMYSVEDRRPTKIAHVCANEMQVTMVRMFAAYIDSFASKGAQLGWFADLKSALTWIELGRASNCRIERAKVVRLLREMGHGWCCLQWPV